MIPRILKFTGLTILCVSAVFSLVIWILYPFMRNVGEDIFHFAAQGTNFFGQLFVIGSMTLAVGIIWGILAGVIVFFTEMAGILTDNYHNEES